MSKGKTIPLSMNLRTKTYEALKSIAQREGQSIEFYVVVLLNEHIREKFTAFEAAGGEE